MEGVNECMRGQYGVFTLTEESRVSRSSRDGVGVAQQRSPAGTLKGEHCTSTAAITVLANHKS